MAVKSTHSVYDDFYHEMKDIQIGTLRRKPQLISHSDDDDICTKTPDGEKETYWLKNAGLSSLIDKFNDGQVIADKQVKAATLTLTPHQRTAVRSRVAALNATISRRQKQQISQLSRDRHPVRKDVRDIFSNESQKYRQSAPAQVIYGDCEPGEPAPTISKVGADTPGHHRRTSETDGACLSTNNTGKNNQPCHPYSCKISLPPSVPTRPHSAPTFRETYSNEDDDEEEDRDEEEEDEEDEEEEEDNEDRLQHDKSRDTNQKTNVTPERPITYNTRIDQLGPKTRHQLQQLAFIELTSIFDLAGLSISRRKRKKRFREQGVFGVSLETLFAIDNQRSKTSNIRVPLIFQEMIYYLETIGIDEQGILRVPGSISRINSLREELDKNYNSGNFDWSEILVNDVAGLMKLFLRELPVPLLTFEFIDAFIKIKDIKEKKIQLSALKYLIIMLPDVHRDTLLMLMIYLRHVTHHSLTRMTLSGVAMIIAPNLFLVAESASKKDALSLSPEDMIGTSWVAQMLIEYQDHIWEVPEFMLSQIRYKNDINFKTSQVREHKNNKKGKQRLRILLPKNKITIKNSLNNKNSPSRESICVCSSLNEKLQLNIKVTTILTAGEVISTFLKNKIDPSINSNKNLYLFATGGNLDYQELNENVRIIDILEMNNTAEWCVRQRQPLLSIKITANN